MKNPFKKKRQIEIRKMGDMQGIFFVGNRKIKMFDRHCIRAMTQFVLNFSEDTEFVVSRDFVLEELARIAMKIGV